MGVADGGGIDAAGSDVAAVDVARLDTGSTTTDTGNHDLHDADDRELDVGDDVVELAHGMRRRGGRGGRHRWAPRGHVGALAALAAPARLVVLRPG